VAPVAGRRAVLAGLAFVVAARATAEGALRLRALALAPEVSGAAVAGGAAAAIVALGAAVFTLILLGRRLGPGTRLATVGPLAAAAAAVLAGDGMRALQQAGAMTIRPLGLPRIDWVGLYPTVETIAAQAVVLAAFVVLGALAVAAHPRPVPAPVVAKDEDDEALDEELPRRRRQRPAPPPAAPRPGKPR
jgi:high-affinity Fe2+/Pb2+ permease